MRFSEFCQTDINSVPKDSLEKRVSKALAEVMFELFIGGLVGTC